MIHVVIDQNSTSVGTHIQLNLTHTQIIHSYIYDYLYNVCINRLLHKHTFPYSVSCNDPSKEEHTQYPTLSFYCHPPMKVPGHLRGMDDSTARAENAQAELEHLTPQRKEASHIGEGITTGTETYQKSSWGTSQRCESFLSSELPFHLQLTRL